MKLTEAKLKQLIKEVMTEAAKGIADLPDGVYVSVEKHPMSEDSYTIRYVNEEGVNPRKSHGFRGTIVIEEPNLADEYPCEGAYMISWAVASDGYGPLLYDVAMEVATLIGGGLVSDRTIVSTDAQRVWRYYLKNRSDVESSQLDNEEDYFENGPEDDCVQNIARATITGDYDDFTDSPLSKVYRKEPDKLRALGNKLRVVGINLPF